MGSRTPLRRRNRRGRPLFLALRLPIRKQPDDIHIRHSPSAWGATVKPKASSSPYAWPGRTNGAYRSRSRRDSGLPTSHQPEFVRTPLSLLRRVYLLFVKPFDAVLENTDGYWPPDAPSAGAAADAAVRSIIAQIARSNCRVTSPA